MGYHNLSELLKIDPDLRVVQHNNPPVPIFTQYQGLLSQLETIVLPPIPMEYLISISAFKLVGNLNPTTVNFFQYQLQRRSISQVY